jgi:hypothetical protein
MHLWNSSLCHLHIRHCEKLKSRLEKILFMVVV